MISIIFRNIFMFYLFYYVTKTIAMNSSTEIPATVGKILNSTNMHQIKMLLNRSRRIMGGFEAAEKRPYMVYLKLPRTSAHYQQYKNWLCGGVIVHEEYVLTSAACIEDVKHFYIVSGTHRHNEDDDNYSNACIKNGAKKAIWKCVPKNYVFDGHENDNIRWMNNDIAIVKIEDEFDFHRRIRGCDYIPKPVCYNNRSAQLEMPGSWASIAGWGSLEKYSDWVNTRREGATTRELMETTVKLIDKRMCKTRWGPKYRNIIDNYMICSADNAETMSEICEEKYVDCTEIMALSDEQEGDRRVLDPNELKLHPVDGRRSSIGGFCENDHGGPLVVGDGVESVVIGVISACLVRERSNKCYGPFLYTSVFKNKALIDCAIYKDASPSCNTLFRASETHEETEFSWADHPDGPAKNEQQRLRRNEDLKNNSTVASTDAANTTIVSIPEHINTNGTPTADRLKIVNNASDVAYEQKGAILRSYTEKADIVNVATKTKN